MPPDLHLLNPQDRIYPPIYAGTTEPNTRMRSLPLAVLILGGIITIGVAIGGALPIVATASIASALAPLPGGAGRGSSPVGLARDHLPAANRLRWRASARRSRRRVGISLSSAPSR